jgi:hypothetical protein
LSESFVSTLSYYHPIVRSDRSEEEKSTLAGKLFFTLGGWAFINYPRFSNPSKYVDQWIRKTGDSAV